MLTSNNIDTSLLRQPKGPVMHSILSDISGFCRDGSNIMQTEHATS